MDVLTCVGFVTIQIAIDTTAIAMAISISIAISIAIAITIAIDVAILGDANGYLLPEAE